MMPPTTTGVSESTLSRLESGQRRATLELLLPLSRTYDVPLDDLVGAYRFVLRGDLDAASRVVDACTIP